MKKIRKMYPKEMKPGLICNVLFGLFIEYVTETEEVNSLMEDDENKKYFVVEGASCLLNADHIKKKNREDVGIKKGLVSWTFYLFTFT